ncbi:MAG: UDP-N-acetylmuramate dehydrogenase [Chitinophagales bacterium]
MQYYVLLPHISIHMMLKENQSLLSYNTFHIDARAKYLVAIDFIDDLRELRETKVFREEKRLVLGGGSNVLLTGDFNGLVIKVNLPGITFMREDEHAFYVRASGGVKWHDFVMHCVANGFAGVENMSLIPGQVGASPIQNIGAYGVELKDVCTHVHAVNLFTGEMHQFSNSDCKFGYRDSIFKHGKRDEWLITHVDFRLTRVPRFHTNYGDIKATLDEMKITELSIQAVSEAVMRIRSSKLPDPEQLGNAGSFFKNPVVSKEQATALLDRYPVMPHFDQEDGVKIPAGWLIEQCGWKGKRVGNTGSHARQALVLVNYGGATGAEVYQLALEIIASVQDRFGITISPEVNLI